MAEPGMFRTGLGGFNKQDVLQYIDELQAEHLRETAALNGQLDAERQALADAQAALSAANEQKAALETQVATLEQDGEQLQKLIDEQNSANRILRARVQEGEEHAKALAAAQEELQSLRVEIGQAAATKAHCEAELQTVDRLKEQVRQAEAAAQAAQQRQRELAEVNRRYQALIGDVGSFVMEIRSMGQHYLTDTRNRAAHSLTDTMQAVAALQRQLCDTAEELRSTEAAMQEENTQAEQQLEELMRTLASTAEAASSAEAASAAETAAQTSPEETPFFR